MINKETMKKQFSMIVNEWLQGNPNNQLICFFFLQCYVWESAEIVGKSGEIKLRLTQQPIP